MPNEALGFNWSREFVGSSKPCNEHGTNNVLKHLQKSTFGDASVIFISRKNEDV